MAHSPPGPSLECHVHGGRPGAHCRVPGTRSACHALHVAHEIRTSDFLILLKSNKIPNLLGKDLVLAQCMSDPWLVVVLGLLFWMCKAKMNT